MEYTKYNEVIASYDMHDEIAQQELKSGPSCTYAIILNSYASSPR